MKNTDTRYAFEIPGRYARGWHVLAFSQELAPGDVRRFTYFEQDIVLFRGHGGGAVAVDAYCPHLGANLGGLGTEVVEDTIRCPFHGWRFNADGDCVAIPYSDSIPERARGALRSWPLVEKNGFIAIWHDPEGGAPEYELPDIPEWGPAGWGDWVFRRSTINSHGREIIENIVDEGHFYSVHGGRPEVFENSFDGHTVTQYSRVRQALDDPDIRMIIPPDLGIDLEAARANYRASETAAEPGDNWATYHGPAIMYFYTENPQAPFPYKSWWLNYYTPIDSETLDLASSVIVAPFGDNELPAEFLELYPETAHAAFWQDVMIWETKIYQSDPILCAGDGAINKLRKWYEQFYLPREPG